MICEVFIALANGIHTLLTFFFAECRGIILGVVNSIHAGVYSPLSRLKMTILPLRKKHAMNLPSGEKLMSMMDD